MNPMLILIPVGLGVAGYLILSAKNTVSSIYQPPPGSPALGSGGARYQSYMDQLNAANIAYAAASIFDSSATSGAAQQLKGTLDVVGNMAQLDLQAKTITQQDLTNIQTKIAALKKQIGG
jgi:hypothetical protein